MMGRLPARQNTLFYDFCLDSHVPKDHLLRQIDQFLEFDEISTHLNLFIVIQAGRRLIRLLQTSFLVFQSKNQLKNPGIAGVFE